MNRNVNRSYELESPYQFINPAHSFLMERKKYLLPQV